MVASINNFSLRMELDPKFVEFVQNLKEMLRAPSEVMAATKQGRRRTSDDFNPLRLKLLVKGRHAKIERWTLHTAASI